MSSAFKCYRYAIVRDMTAAGAGLNKFCYAGLITAHMNKIPRTEDVAAKVTCSYFSLSKMFSILCYLFISLKFI